MRLFLALFALFSLGVALRCYTHPEVIPSRHRNHKMVQFPTEIKTCPEGAICAAFRMPRATRRMCATDCPVKNGCKGDYCCCDSDLCNRNITEWRKKRSGDEALAEGSISTDSSTASAASTSATSETPQDSSSESVTQGVPTETVAPTESSTAAPSSVPPVVQGEPQEETSTTTDTTTNTPSDAPTSDSTTTTTTTTTSTTTTTAPPSTTTKKAPVEAKTKDPENEDNEGQDVDEDDAVVAKNGAISSAVASVLSIMVAVIL